MLELGAHRTIMTTLSAPPLPERERVVEHVQAMLDRDSQNVGLQGGQDRLLLMLTRSCELRCSYCFVRLTEDGAGQDFDGRYVPHATTGVPPTAYGDMPLTTAMQSVDWLLRSTRDRLGIQFFGGEPARRWDVLTETLQYLRAHPERRGREVEVLFTTNGLGLTPERLHQIKDADIRIQFSLDGDARGSRFRRGHLLTQEAAVAGIESTIDALNSSGVWWFMNATLPPAASGEVLDRYRWALERGVPALQINYVTGMHWTEERERAYLEGLQTMLLHHHANPHGIDLFNWFNEADPVPLCGDIIVDVDGQVYQVGALFHEKRSPELKSTYCVGRVTDSGLPFTNTRLTLSELAERTRQALRNKDKQRQVFFDNVRLGAAVDLVVQQLKDQLGK